MHTTRRWLTSVLLALTAVLATAIGASPALADPSTSFTGPGGLIWGSVTWNYDGGHHQLATVNASIYGTSPVPGYTATGAYFEGSARIYCGQGPARNNGSDGIVRTYSDSLRCDRARVQQVMLVFRNPYGVLYLDSPYR
jgi:hypothetical protein